ncbi:uncharacterized protein BKCO1_4700087 [Diplodia corticola]|uniref:Uncharacterized protein n=1 Tax=Diplodia corticola TaxID=236234 RepID=A0A1J9RG09_9PEZI|nr:uncharacterized protein BKCO1_4700087 [Diplodia corticola]OJD31483.1 hypothetical protein BKCO1_4700087 [Diplodia corticola]
MKFFAIPTVLLSAQLALAAPLEQRADKRDDAPSPESFREAISAKKTIGRDQTIFYTGGGCAARSCISYKKDHGLIKIQDVEVLDVNDPSKYEDDDVYQKAVNNWSKAFAQLSSGVAWVMFRDGNKIDESRGSVWNKEEWPALKDNDDVEEIIQIDGTDVSKIQQIWPVEIRKEEGTCAWYGTAPLCNAQCPDGYDKKAESRYGSDTTACTSGKKLYCCKKD